MGIWNLDTLKVGFSPVVGFTGTQRDMNVIQRNVVTYILERLSPSKGVHGDCIGADRTFNHICRQMNIWTEAYPGMGDDGKSYKRAYCRVNFKHEPIPYLVRNQIIVDVVDYMIATPGELTEQLRSGTWSTIRKARRKDTSKLYIVLPNGDVTN